MYKLEQLQDLLPHANDSQKVKIEATIANGCNMTKAAKELGMSATSVIATIKVVAGKAAKTMSPMAALNPNETPAGFGIDRISKHIDKKGHSSGWVIAIASIFRIPFFHKNGAMTRSPTLVVENEEPPPSISIR